MSLNRCHYLMVFHAFACVPQPPFHHVLTLNGWVLRVRDLTGLSSRSWSKTTIVLASGEVINGGLLPQNHFFFLTFHNLEFFFTVASSYLTVSTCKCMTCRQKKTCILYLLIRQLVLLIRFLILSKSWPRSNDYFHFGHST